MFWHELDATDGDLCAELFDMVASVTFTSFQFTALSRDRKLGRDAVLRWLFLDSRIIAHFSM